MKYGLVVILVAGIVGLTVGEASTCADYFNPLVSSFTASHGCYGLEVDGTAVGFVNSSDVVKTQGPNKGEKCFRFTFVVRDGLGIRRAKVGLWLRDIPSDNARFTRKRKFLDSEPTTVRVDACLDDIQTERDCCSGGGGNLLLVGEAKVRMEDGKVRTASLVGNRSPTPVRLQASDSPPASSTISCPDTSPISACDPSAGEDAEFLTCGLELSCKELGEEPLYVGINRIDIDGGTVQLVASPLRGAQEILPSQLELTVYEGIPTSTEAPMPAEAKTVIRRPASSLLIEDSSSSLFATFSVPELSGLPSSVAFAVEFVNPEVVDIRYSVRASLEIQRNLIQFVSFRSSPALMFAATGPLNVGKSAVSSLYGELPSEGVVGRIGSVICGYCIPAYLGNTLGEWVTLEPNQTQGLNEGQFDFSLARLPNRCIFEAEIEMIGSECGPAGEGLVRRQVR
ncbi:hypothetical protein NDN08_006435 [Rhodosorus marinus]|uniref:Uncharacterized protein n=1 Tax=Rhodosorus marinus TaxID=101924 RepID=A0AAV8UKP2_9RHOD|nr:hypothetical protein NDN08_006435 [Rhodosorus marinus]